MSSAAAVALANCSILRPEHTRGVEVVVAGSGVRTFPVRVSEGLGICVKHGAAHEVKVEGRRLHFPADSVSVRAPGCVWASETGVHGFVSIDIAPELLPGDWAGPPMSFVGPRALPDVGRAARRLLAAGDALEAGGVVAELLDGVVASGALASDVVRAEGNGTAAVKQAREFLRARIGGRPTLDDVAAVAGVSKYALVRSFRKAHGTTPHAYLVRVRVNRAQALLARGAAPAEVAAAAGFSDQAHMGAWFRRLVGVTPAAYRRSVRCAISF